MSAREGMAITTAAPCASLSPPNLSDFEEACAALAKHTHDDDDVLTAPAAAVAAAPDGDGSSSSKRVKKKKKTRVKMQHKDYSNRAKTPPKQVRAGRDVFATFDRHDRSTWPTTDEAHAPLHLAQSDFMWGLRTHPRMAEVFAHVHHSTPDNMVRQSVCDSRQRSSSSLPTSPRPHLLR